ncbi:hypothetical protein BLOT_007953, partial [Blomia tropicalis]
YILLRICVDLVPSSKSVNKDVDCFIGSDLYVVLLERQNIWLIDSKLFSFYPYDKNLKVDDLPWFQSILRNIGNFLSVDRTIRYGHISECKVSPSELH